MHQQGSGHNKKNSPSGSKKSRTCDYPFGSSSALPLNYNVLEGDKPSNHPVLVTIGLHTARTEMSKLWHTSNQDGECKPVKF